MAKTRPGALATNDSTVVRNDVAANESTTLSDGNFAPADATMGAGWKSVLIFPRFTGGTSPTVVVQTLVRAGSAWLAGPKTAPLSENQYAEIDVMGRDVFFRIDTLAGAPTSVDLHCAGFEPFRYDGPRG